MADTTSTGPLHDPNPVVFFDMTLSGEALGRIKMELFADTVPRTAENFRQFCTGESKGGNGRAQGYKGGRFHRVVSLTHSSFTLVCCSTGGWAG